MLDRATDVLREQVERKSDRGIELFDPEFAVDAKNAVFSICQQVLVILV